MLGCCNISEDLKLFQSTKPILFKNPQNSPESLKRSSMDRTLILKNYPTVDQNVHPEEDPNDKSNVTND